MHSRAFGNSSSVVENNLVTETSGNFLSEKKLLFLWGKKVPNVLCAHKVHLLSKKKKKKSVKALKSTFQTVNLIRNGCMSLVWDLQNSLCEQH